MKKNICLITSGLSGDGVAKVVLSLAQSFSELNCRVHVIVLDFNSRNAYPLVNLTFNIHILEAKKIKHSIKNEKHITQYIRSVENSRSLRNKITEIGIDFDLIISNKFLTDIACKKLNMPNTYYCIHSTISEVIAGYYNKKTGLLKILYKALYLFSIKRLYKHQKLIAVSKGVRKDLIKLGIQPKTIQAIYNPFNFNDIRQQSKAYQIKEKNYIIHVGNFNQTLKRHDILIKSYKQSGVKEKLLLLGDSSGKTGNKIKQLVVNLRLENQVIFKEFNPNPFPYIKNAKVLVLSSDIEGLPTVLIEALILKTPVVSTNCPSGPSEILIDELKPFLSPVGDVNALAKNIKKMVENPIKITDKYIEKFSAEISVNQYLSLCDKKY